MSYITTDTTGAMTLVSGTTGTDLSLPAGVSVQRARPSVAVYRDRRYIVGQYSPGLVRTEFGTLDRIGLVSPSTIPTLAADSSGTITANVIGRITFAEVINGVTIHESAPGGTTATVALTNQGRSWTGLPATGPARANKIRGYVSADGAEFRFAWERNIGTTTVSEGVATLALGDEVNENRGVPPYSKYIEIYHDRAWYAGIPQFPDRIYFSELEEPESVGAENFLKTRDGEAITGIKRVRDYLVVFCRKSTYTIQGFTEDDFNMQKASPNIGCISYGSIVNIDDRLWFASEDGVYLFDGSFKFLMKNLKIFWRDAYLLDVNGDGFSLTATEDSIAGDDRYRKIYKLLVVQRDSPFSFYYCGHYNEFEPELEGAKGQPDWTFDVRIRHDSAVGLVLATNSMRDEFYTGSCDGYVRKENQDDVGSDDGDDKVVILRTGHFLYNDPGGGRNHGKTLTDLDIYLESENDPWTLDVFGGDEEAKDALLPMFTATRPASALTDTDGHEYLAQSVHHFRTTMVTGRGFTFQTSATNPVGFEYRGLGGAWKVGGATRPRKT